jgi:RNA polymerase sigma factor (sigma-70 family)
MDGDDTLDTASCGFPESRLVTGLRDGSPDAFAELHDRFAPGLRRLAAGLLPEDPQAAEDITVDALADVVRNIAQFDPSRSGLRAWVYGIARWKVREERRRRRRRGLPLTRPLGPAEGSEDLQDGHDVADEVASRLDARRQVAALSTLLSEAEMEVIVLQCVDQLSVREISRIVRRSERAVHSLLHRARQKARERLVQDDG